MSGHVYTKEEIERSFNLLARDVERNTGKGTGAEDVLLYLYENPQKIWHWSWELIGKVTSQGVRLSHKSDARLSELATHDHHLVERRRIKRYAVYRLRTENVHLVKARLGTKKEQPPEREQVLPEKCKHGLPVFVQCPDCKKI